ncbi:hypothetical protein ACFL3S_01205, partial [Gemmatimonadota bacterium]
MSREPERVLQDASRFLNGHGYFRSEDADPVRAAVAVLSDARSLPDHPAEVFGPWASLPAAAQGALRRLTEEEISRVMDKHPRGYLWPQLARSLYYPSRALRASGRAPKLASLADTWTRRVSTGPAKLSEKLYVRSHRAAWQKAERISVADLLAGLGRLPRWLLGDYVTGVRVDPRARGFFHDRARNVIWGYSVGVDLIPSPDGVWCVEANLSSGAFQDDGWDELDIDGAIDRLFQAVRTLGAQTLWWHGMDWFPIHPRLIRALENTAESAGMKVTIREDFRVPPAPGLPKGASPPRKRLMSPTDAPADTLVFRRNDYRVGSDWVVSDKEPFIRGIGSALREVGDRRCRVPAMTLAPQDLRPPSDDGLPNLVYKYPDSEWGFGVHFMR